MTSTEATQDVWSKKSREAPETDKSEYKPEILDYEQAKAVEAQNMRYKGVDKSGESGIIKKEEPLIGTWQMVYEKVLMNFFIIRVIISTKYIQMDITITLFYQKEK